MHRRARNDEKPTATTRGTWGTRACSGWAVTVGTSPDPTVGGKPWRGDSF